MIPTERLRVSDTAQGLCTDYLNRGEVDRIMPILQVSKLRHRDMVRFEEAQGI